MSKKRATNEALSSVLSCVRQLLDRTAANDQLSNEEEFSILRSTLATLAEASPDLLPLSEVFLEWIPEHWGGTSAAQFLEQGHERLAVLEMALVVIKKTVETSIQMNSEILITLPKLDSLCDFSDALDVLEILFEYPARTLGEGEKVRFTGVEAGSSIIGLALEGGAIEIVGQIIALLFASFTTIIALAESANRAMHRQELREKAQAFIALALREARADFREGVVAALSRMGADEGVTNEVANRLSTDGYDKMYRLVNMGLTIDIVANPSLAELMPRKCSLEAIKSRLPLAIEAAPGADGDDSSAS